MNLRKTLEAWPVLRQLRGPDRLGLGEAARSPRSARLAPRTADADKVVPSVCPYCAVGCGQKVYVKDGRVEWEELPLEVAMDRIADRVITTRNETWQATRAGRRVNRTLGMASLGGATLDNEENYLIKKLFTALGAVQIENQARI